MPWGLFTWLFNNWKIVAIFILLLFILGLTGTITNSIRRAKNGLKELFNPLGVIVICIFLYFVFLLFKDLGIIK